MDDRRAGQDDSKRRTFDWISSPQPDLVTPFQQFTLDVDWTKSPLGPMSSWPPQLRQMVLLVMHDSSPAVVYWSDETTIVYNEAYTHLIGQKHPALQGADPRVEFAEVWDHFERLLARQRATAETVVEENAFLLFLRHGFLEETFFSWKFVPIIGPDGWVVGSHATVFEVTRAVLSERRLETVRSLGAQLSQSKNIQDLWSRLRVGLEAADKDIPLALIYSVANTFGVAGSGSGSSSPSSTVVEPPSCGTPATIACVLEGAIGVAKGHKLAPEHVDINDSADIWLVRPFQEAMATLAQVVIDPSQCPRTREAMEEGIEWRGYGTPSNKIVINPIVPTNSKDVLGFIVIALNPRRPYNDDYRSFVHLLTEQVTSPQLSAVILREEVESRQMAAREEAIDRGRLRKELSDSETKLARFATRAPFGLAILAPDGTVLSENALWRELTQCEAGAGKVDWTTILAPGHIEPVMSSWERMIATRTPVTTHTQMKRPWKAPELESDGSEIWGKTNVLLTIYPDLDAGGEVVSVMCCITDISSLKWSEEQLRKRMVQAIEMKQQQERFIDMTSHEMRNPLSALIGCADEIIASLRSLREQSKSSTPQKEAAPLPSLSPHFDNPEVDALLDEAIAAADTIIYCALHQKRIIDDILTLSRLDSQLLLVCPEPAQPILLIRNALKMFEAELKQADINIELVERDSLAELNVQWTLLDPSRVLQVFLNLMTNAIKFTRNEKVREIKVTIGASLDKPSRANNFDIKYVKKNNTNLDQTPKTEWGDREAVYIAITVKDTGRGLAEEEINKLFQLFTQASPKTHQTYGGSGLGLFISRQLVEMQGGEIGVASTAGKGSTFEFYIKTRRTDPATGQKLTDLQLLMREETLREACGTELPPLHPNIKRAGSFESRRAEQNSLNSTTLPIRPVPDVYYIMVVEDNLVNQKVVAKSLRKAGHVVSVANHGEEGLALIRRSDFWTANRGGDKLSVILMDMEMPVMSGMECVRRIRELQREGLIRGHIPILAVTANARKDQVLEAIEAGMDDVTIKPYRIHDMLQQIEVLVSRHQESQTPEHELE